MRNNAYIVLQEQRRGIHNMTRTTGSSNKKVRKMSVSFRLEQVYIELLDYTKTEHGLSSRTEALEYLLKEKAIELAIEEASLD
jgi:GTP cyclohydrolase FolE2